MAFSQRIDDPEYREFLDDLSPRDREKAIAFYGYPARADGQTSSDSDEESEYLTEGHLRNLKDQSDWTFDRVEQLESRVEKLEAALADSRLRSGYSYTHFNAGVSKLQLSVDSGMFTGLRTPALIGVLIGLVASYWLAM